MPNNQQLNRYCGNEFDNHGGVETIILTAMMVLALSTGIPLRREHQASLMSCYGSRANCPINLQVIVNGFNLTQNRQGIGDRQYLSGDPTIRVSSLLLDLSGRRLTGMKSPTKLNHIAISTHDLNDIMTGQAGSGLRVVGLCGIINNLVRDAS
jgi:hypothetical protein